MSNPRSMVLMLLLIAIGGGAYWLLSQQSDPVLDSAGDSETALDRDAGESKDPTPDGAPIEKLVTNPFDPRVEEPITTEEAERFEEAVPDGKRLRVVHEVSGRPIPGAIVLYASQSGMGSEEKLTRAFVSSSGFGDFIMKKGRIFRCDAKGETKVPFDPSVMAIYARKGDLMGTLDWRSAQRSLLEVKVGEGQHVKVKVEDADGNSVADVPVALRIERGQRKPGFDLLKAKSDANGIAHLRHIQNPLALMSMGRSVTNCSVALALPMLNAPKAVIDPRNLPEEPVLLKLPQTRSCSVRVRTPNGAAPPKGTVVLIAHPDLWTSRRQPPTGAAVATCNDEGTAFFHHIPNTDKWKVVAWHEDIPVDVELSSKKAGMNTLPSTIDLEWNPVFPTYRARVLDHEGKPLPSARIKVSASSRGRDSEFKRLDQDSYLTLELAQWTEKKREHLIETHGLTPPMSGRLELPEFQSGIHDLPDVRLSRLPVLVEGRVLDPEGNPLPQAEVRASWQASGDVRNSELFRRHRYSALSAVCDAEGRYSLHGIIIPEATLRIKARHSHYEASQRDEVAAGSRGVDIKLGAVGSLVARLRFPDWCDPKRDLTIALRSGDKSVANSIITKPLKIKVESGVAHLAWETVPVGTWSLAIHGSAQDNYGFLTQSGLFMDSARQEQKPPPGILIQGIRVEVGANRDSRLQDMDIGPFVRPMTIKFGEPIPEAGTTVSAGVRGPIGRMSYYGDIKNGEWRITLPQNAETAAISIDGFREHEVELVGTEIRVHLTRTSNTIFEFTNAPEDTRRISASVKSLSEKKSGVFGTYVSVSSPSPGKWASRPMDLKPGSYRLSGTLFTGKENAKGEDLRTQRITQIIEVGPPTGQATTIEVPVQ